MDDPLGNIERLAGEHAGVIVVGTCELVDVVGPLTLRDLRKDAAKLAEPKSDVSSLPYKLPMHGP